MEHIYAIARATQKALLSANTEFQRELIAKEMSPPSNIKSSHFHSPPPATTNTITRTPTLTITQTELNSLREAMYTGIKR